MKYYFKENFHLFLPDGAVYDEYDREVYRYENETFMFPEISLYKYGRKVGHVKKNFSLFLREYDLFVGDQLADTINQQFSLFKAELELAKSGWYIKGDFWALNYQIFNQNDDLVAEVNQEILTLTKRYFVNIIDESSETFIMLIVLAINQFDRDSSAASSSITINHNN